MTEADYWGKKSEPFFEEVTERIGNCVLASKIRDATKEEIARAAEQHAAGKCPHNIVVDEYAYMYDFRSCFTCGKGLGTV